MNTGVLKLLFGLRNIYIILQILVLLTATRYLNIPIELQPLQWIIGFFMMWNLLMWWRINQIEVASNAEVTINLAVDLIVLTGLFYFSGGPTNPFITLLIVPIALGAVFLPGKLLGLLLILAITFYTFLMEWYLPFPEALHQHSGEVFQLHVIGMWANFNLSAVILAIFVFILAHKSRQYQQALADTREKLLRNQQVTKIGMLAASAAHEINTPLASIGLLATEISESSDKNQIVEDARVISQQVALCKNQILILQGQAAEEKSQPLQKGVIQSLKIWLASHPEIELTQTVTLNDTDQLPPELSTVIVILLDNAAEASLLAGNSKVTVLATIKDQQVIIDIEDEGDGLPEQQKNLLGKMFYTDKKNGMGIGLMLSHVSLEQIHGHLQLMPLPSRGTRARVTFPVNYDA